MEKKFYDTYLVNATINSTADCSSGEQDQSATICATTIPQGDGESQRDGRKAEILSVHYKGTILIPERANQSTQTTYPIVYIAMVLDTQTNGTQIVSENVFENPSASTRLCVTPLQNLENQKRFRVLKVWRHDFMPATNGSTGSTFDTHGYSKSFDLFHKFKTPLKINYSNTTESIASTADNSVHLIAYCSATGATPTLNYNCRTRFVG